MISSTGSSQSFQKFQQMGSGKAGVLLSQWSRYATLLLADSEVGKEDILNFYGPYGVTPDQVKVLPFLPACYLATDISESERQRVRTTYHLPERYLFYPAQFWPHKNHTRIVQALGLLRQDTASRFRLCSAALMPVRSDRILFREVSCPPNWGLRKNPLSWLCARRRYVRVLCGSSGIGDADFFRPDEYPVSGSMGIRLSSADF